MKDTSCEKTLFFNSILLSKAVIRAAENLEVSQVLLAKVLGISESTLTKVYSGTYQLDKNCKESAVLFVRMYLLLVSLVGNKLIARTWLQNENQNFYAKPIDLICSNSGLTRVVEYLEVNCFK